MTDAEARGRELIAEFLSRQARDDEPWVCLAEPLRSAFEAIDAARLSVLPGGRSPAGSYEIASLAISDQGAQQLTFRMDANVRQVSATDEVGDELVRGVWKLRGAVVVEQQSDGRWLIADFPWPGRLGQAARACQLLDSPAVIVHPGLEVRLVAVWMGKRIWHAVDVENRTAQPWEIVSLRKRPNALRNVIFPRHGWARPLTVHPGRARVVFCTWGWLRGPRPHTAIVRLWCAGHLCSAKLEVPFG